MSDYISKSRLIEELKNTTYVFKHFGRRESVGLGEVVSTIEHQPTLDETEIIRKFFERVVERLGKYRNFEDNDSLDRQCIDRTIEIVKEECGISE